MKINKRDRRTNLEKEIDKLMSELDRIAPTCETYQKTLSTIERLEHIRGDRQQKKRTISPDTIAVVAGNLLGIILILNYEKINVVTSKALGFVIRGRA